MALLVNVSGVLLTDFFHIFKRRGSWWAVTLFGIYRFAEFPYDDALNISKSLNIALESKSAGYDSNAETAHRKHGDSGKPVI
jgi:hypothetical protein